MDGAKAPERSKRPPMPISCLLHRQQGGGVRKTFGFSPPVPKASLHHKRSLSWVFLPRSETLRAPREESSGRTNGRTDRGGTGSHQGIPSKLGS
jgi:hypothetical protein